MNRMNVLVFAATLFVSNVAFADVAIDPCEGKDGGSECTLLAGGTGTCVSNQGVLSCEAPANNTNNSTNNASNNASNNSSNNGTPTATDNEPVDDGTPAPEAKKDDGGCSTTGDVGGLMSVLFGLGLVMLGRKRS